MSRIAVVGSGSWGTALALSLARRGDHSIALWSHSAAVGTYLPGFPIPPQVDQVMDLAVAVVDADIVISAVPSQHVRAIYNAMAPFLVPGQIIVSATKGIEDQTFLRMTQVIEQVLAERKLNGSLPCGALSGPSFAQEVASGAPTAITIACRDSRLGGRLQEELSAPALRLYTNDDVIGVELGGALKNVIAIAAGIAAGLGLGHNSAAAIITRGVAEITRLAVACGGRRETLAGLSGWVTWCSPAPVRSRVTARLGLNSAGGISFPPSWRSCRAKSQKAYGLPRRRSDWPKPTTWRCPSPSRWPPFSSMESRPRTLSVN
jgi:glycerol-3-phosphate dehydrogenase (NAD(P)+)